MMYGNGTGSVWMPLMWLLWVVLIAAIVWAVVRLAQRPAGGEHRTQPRETPEEILDRRFALGEIDEDSYTRARDRLAGHRSGT